jgi:16S rRNA (adenine1518-N6/adenine1519-N6)-dimethyltransferase
VSESATRRDLLDLPAVNPASRIPTSRRDWTRLMGELGIRPNKGLGQHFLFERGLVERMVRQAGVTRADSVLEVGPGLGILTSELLRKAGRVVAVELDRSLIAHLESAFGNVPGFELVSGNALALTAGEPAPARAAAQTAPSHRHAAEGGRRPPRRPATRHERARRRHAVLR